MATHDPNTAAPGPFAALGPEAWIERLPLVGAQILGRDGACVALWADEPASRWMACGVARRPFAALGWGARPDLVDPADRLLDAWERALDAEFRQVPGPLNAVLWDRREARLYAFRDRLGQYPLFWIEEDDRVVVGPDPARLLELMGRRPVPDIETLRAFLLGREDGQPRDFLDGVRWIRPGERLCWGPGQAVEAKFWWKPNARDGDTTDLTDLGEAAAAVADAVDRELSSALADGPAPVGLLSGGVDSSVLMARLTRLAPASADDPREVYSMVSRQMPSCDERAEIETIARALSLRVHFVSLDELWSLRDLQPYQRHWSLGPVALPNDNTLEHLFTEVASHHRGSFALTGVGADQLFAGTRSASMRAMLSRGDVVGLWREAGKGVGAWVARELVREGLERVRLAAPARQLRRRLSRGGPDAISRQATPPWLEPGRWTRGGAEEEPPPTPGANRSRRDFHLGWNWEHACRTTFRASLASGATGLHPFMSAPLWELAARLDDSLLYRDGLPKPVLREIGRGALPESIVARPKRQHFGKLVEKGLAIREVERVRALLQAPRLAELGLVDPAELRRAYEAYVAAVRPVFPIGPHVPSLPLWWAISAEIWLRALP